MVRGLEGWLGHPLFHRSPTGKARLTATDAAERALPDIRAGLDRLGIGLERLREVTTDGILSSPSAPPSPPNGCCRASTALRPAALIPISGWKPA